MHHGIAALVAQTTDAGGDVAIAVFVAVEVSVDAYKACVAAGRCQPPDTGAYCNWDKPGKGRHPVNCVDALQAEAYCTFVGKRLPTEAEASFALEHLTAADNLSDGLRDLMWALVNTKEFIFNH